MLIWLEKKPRDFNYESIKTWISVTMVPFLFFFPVIISTTFKIIRKYLFFGHSLNIVMIKILLTIQLCFLFLFLFNLHYIVFPLGLLNAAEKFEFECLQNACWEFAVSCIRPETINELIASANQYPDSETAKLLLKNVSILSLLWKRVTGVPSFSNNYLGIRSKISYCWGFSAS